MAQTIKLRRASGENSAGKVPTTAQLDLGEVAINTYDGRVFIKQSGSGDDENIRHIITTDSETTGSINLIGSITASNDISASGQLKVPQILTGVTILGEDGNSASTSEIKFKSATGFRRTISFTDNDDIVQWGMGVKTSVLNGDFKINGGSNVNLDNADGLIIKNSTYNVGIGTQEAPEKLTVEGNISASGLLYASASHPSTHTDSIFAVVYDTGSGQFYYTGSYGSGGDSDGYIGDAQSHTAGGSLNMNDNSIISASAIFAQGAITSSVTGSTNPSDYLPSTIGGTFQPATFVSSEEVATATYDVDVVSQAQLFIGQWPPPNQFMDVPFYIELPSDRLAGSIVIVTEISASGNLSGNSRIIKNITFPNNVVVVKEFGEDSNAAGGSTFVPMFELDINTGTFVAENTVNSNANVFAYGDDVGDSPGDWTTIYDNQTSGNRVFFTLNSLGLVNPTLNLRFKFQYISTTSDAANNHTIGKGFSTGELPHNYSSIIYNSGRQPSPNLENAPKGLAITLTSGFGTASPNSSFVDFYMGSGAFIDTGFQPATLSKIGGIFPTTFNGDGVPGGITLGSISDKRLKENITYSDKGLNEIKKIKLRNFNWKTSKNQPPQTGFIAQELYKVIPEAVKVGAKKLKDVNKDPWMVSEDKIIPYLVGAIQQQQDMIEALQKEVKFLKKKIK